MIHYFKVCVVKIYSRQTYYSLVNIAVCECLGSMSGHFKNVTMCCVDCGGFFYQPYGVNQAGATIKYAATRTDRSTQESSGGCTREHCAVGILATFSRFSCVNVWVRFYAGFVWSLKGIHTVEMEVSTH